MTWCSKLNRWMKRAGVMRVAPDPLLEPDHPYDPEFLFRAYDERKLLHMAHVRWATLLNTREEWQREYPAMPSKLRWDEPALRALEEASRQRKERLRALEALELELAGTVRRRRRADALAAWRAWTAVAVRWTRLGRGLCARDKRRVKLERIEQDTARRLAAPRNERAQAAELLQLLTLEANSILAMDLDEFE